MMYLFVVGGARREGAISSNAANFGPKSRKENHCQHEYVVKLLV